MVKLPFSLNLKSLRKKAQKDTFFTIDVGSNSVKCLAFKLDGETPNTLRLIGAGRELLEPQSVRAGNIIELDAVAEAVEVLAIEAPATRRFSNVVIPSVQPDIDNIV